MSTTRTVTVWCDHDYNPETGRRGCDLWYAGSADTVKDARAETRRQGWRYVPGHPAAGVGRDFCPKHARELRANLDGDSDEEKR
jgi:hypothetical protein